MASCLVWQGAEFYPAEPTSPVQEPTTPSPAPRSVRHHLSHLTIPQLHNIRNTIGGIVPSAGRARQIYTQSLFSATLLRQACPDQRPRSASTTLTLLVSPPTHPLFPRLLPSPSPCLSSPCNRRLLFHTTNHQLIKRLRIRERAPLSPAPGCIAPYPATCIHHAYPDLHAHASTPHLNR